MKIQKGITFLSLSLFILMPVRPVLAQTFAPSPGSTTGAIDGALTGNPCSEFDDIVDQVICVKNSRFASRGPELGGSEATQREATNNPFSDAKIIGGTSGYLAPDNSAGSEDPKLTVTTLKNIQSEQQGAVPLKLISDSGSAGATNLMFTQGLMNGMWFNATTGNTNLSTGLEMAKALGQANFLKGLDNYPAMKQPYYKQRHVNLGVTKSTSDAETVATGDTLATSTSAAGGLVNSLVGVGDISSIIGAIKVIPGIGGIIPSIPGLPGGLPGTGSTPQTPGIGGTVGTGTGNSTAQSAATVIGAAGTIFGSGFASGTGGGAGGGTIGEYSVNSGALTQSVNTSALVGAGAGLIGSQLGSTQTVTSNITGPVISPSTTAAIIAAVKNTRLSSRIFDGIIYAKKGGPNLAAEKDYMSKAKNTFLKFYGDVQIVEEVDGVQKKLVNQIIPPVKTLRSFSKERRDWVITTLSKFLYERCKVENTRVGTINLNSKITPVNYFNYSRKEFGGNDLQWKKYLADLGNLSMGPSNKFTPMMGEALWASAQIHMLSEEQDGRAGACSYDSSVTCYDCQHILEIGKMVRDEAEVESPISPDSREAPDFGRFLAYMANERAMYRVAVEIPGGILQNVSAAIGNRSDVEREYIWNQFKRLDENLRLGMPKNGEELANEWKEFQEYAFDWYRANTQAGKQIIHSYRRSENQKSNKRFGF